MQISDISDKVQVNSHKNAKVAQMTKRDFSTERKYKKAPNRVQQQTT